MLLVLIFLLLCMPIMGADDYLQKVLSPQQAVAMILPSEKPFSFKDECKDRCLVFIYKGAECADRGFTLCAAVVLIPYGLYLSTHNKVR